MNEVVYRIVELTTNRVLKKKFYSFSTAKSVATSMIKKGINCDIVVQEYELVPTKKYKRVDETYIELKGIAKGLYG